MLQICMRTPMPKCGFNKVALQLLSVHGCRKPLEKQTLLLNDECLHVNSFVKTDSERDYTTNKMFKIKEYDATDTM